MLPVHQPREAAAEFFGTFILIVFGVGLMLLIRWQLAYPEQPIPLLGNLFSQDHPFLPGGIMEGARRIGARFRRSEARPIILLMIGVMGGLFGVPRDALPEHARAAVRPAVPGHPR